MMGRIVLILFSIILTTAQGYPTNDDANMQSQLMMESDKQDAAYMETNPSYQQVMMTKNGDVLEDDMQALSQDDQGEYPELQSNYEDEGQEETPAQSSQNQLQDVMMENEAISENDVVIQTHYQNNWDGDLRVVCPKGSALYKFQSIHNNHREDRLWRFDCKKVGGYTYVKCNWYYHINDYDSPMHFMCPANYYMAGVRSHHDNHREDRVWGVYCCHKRRYCTRHCRTTAYLNQMDRPLYYRSNVAFTGLSSYHSNHYEDRQWKVTECAIKHC